MSCVVDFLYPPRCLICGLELQSQLRTLWGELVDLCPECLLPLKPKAVEGEATRCSCCEEPLGLPEGHQLTRCLACRVIQPPMRKIASLYRYDFLASQVLKALKYQGKWPLGKHIGHLMAASLGATSLDSETGWDLVVGLPSSKASMASRGFNHTGLIARAFAKELNTPHSANALVANRPHMAQAALSPKHRARNVKGVFSADPKLVCGKTLLLIDDVVTSSASVSAASGALLGAGALAVDVYTLARSDKFRFSRFALLDTGPEVGHVVTGGIKDCFKFGHGLTQQSGAKRWPFYSDVC